MGEILGLWQIVLDIPSSCVEMCKVPGAFPQQQVVCHGWGGCISGLPVTFCNLHISSLFGSNPL